MDDKVVYSFLKLFYLSIPTIDIQKLYDKSDETHVYKSQYQSCLHVVKFWDDLRKKYTIIA
mgnify:CR=1 FL=1